MEKRSNARVMNLEIYTDGSCKANGKSMTFGGWAFIVTQGGVKIYEAAGSEYGTTNQRMELTAILEALRYARSIRRPSEKVVIYSDSAYAINCYKQEWYINWIHNGWTNSKGENVANQDLWEEIIPFFDNFWYSFVKVDGHNGVLWNERCDENAQKSAEKLKLNWRGSKNDHK